MASELLEVVNVPLTTTEYVFSDSDFRRLRDFDPRILVFTSSIGAEGFALSRLDFLRGRKVIAIGDATLSALRSCGVEANVPSQKDSRGLASYIKSEFQSGDRVALMRSNKPERSLNKSLSGDGFEVVDFTLYELRERVDAKIPGISGVFGILATSPLEIEIFIRKFGRSVAKHYFSIGQTTAARMRSLGINVSDPVGNSNFVETIRMIEREYLQ